MKKFILPLALMVCSNTFAVTVDDLGFKSVFRTFYPKMFNASMRDMQEEVDRYQALDDQDKLTDDFKLPQVGVNDAKTQYLAFLYPPEPYKNANNEDRYLVYVKKREIAQSFDEHDRPDGYGFSDTCHACSSGRVDLYIFKKNANGTYDLVSRSKNNLDYASTYGDVALDVKGLSHRIVKTGENEVGFFDTTFHASHYGATDNYLHLIRLNETEVKGYLIAESSGDNSGSYGEDEQSPLSYEYSSEYRTVEQPNVQDYPVEIKYKGDHYNEDKEKVEKFNKINRYVLNRVKGEYVLSSSQNY
ncbi:hypothetical protein [Acinetobacter sp. P1(2025)]|uniref:hypothetical protein n=1 Tax=Acinetobacter sp. P1(2025) TaxID=3446120 RepID=UPI003F539672